jgi:hypothetical protein
VENYVKGATFRGTPMAEIRSAVASWLKGRPELSTRQIKPEAVRRFLSERGDQLSSEARRAASAKL